MSDDDRTASGRPRRDFRTDRLEAFSDGVFAIAITLLVLELSVPVVGEDHLAKAMLDEWPQYLAYVVSFSTIGLVWLGHTTITEYLERADYQFIRLNLILLLIVGFIPFPTKVVAEYIGENKAERVAVTVYGLTLLAASIAVSLLWRYAVKHELVNIPSRSDEDVKSLATRIAPSLGGYLVFLLLGLFRPTAAVIGYLVMALLFILPVGRLVGQHGGFRGRRKRAAR